MLEISLNMYHAVALGAFLFWLGGVITSKISFLNRYCIPAPLVGGLCFSIVNCILYSSGVASVTFDDKMCIRDSLGHLYVIALLHQQMAQQLAGQQGALSAHAYDHNI